MTNTIHGFTKVDMREHDLARWLRKHKAIDNYQTGPANGNTWYGPDGKAVAVCLYDNTNSTNSTWLRNDLIEG